VNDQQLEAEVAAVKEMLHPLVEIVSGDTLKSMDDVALARVDFLARECGKELDRLRPIVKEREAAQARKPGWVSKGLGLFRGE
jgi:hypothetical protein